MTYFFQAFDPSSSSPGTSAEAYQQQHSVTGRPLNKFKQAVNANDLERVPSIRDWQANRLQPPGGKPSPKLPNGATNQNQADRSRGYSQDRMQTQAVLHKGPATYEQPSNRPEASQGARPYAIASPDGKSKYEAKTHLRDYEPSRKAVGAQPPWQRIAEPDLPPNYDTYMHNSSAVPPTQLREALERVASSSPHDTGYSSQAGQGSPRYGQQYSPQTGTDQISPRYGGGGQYGGRYQRSPHNVGYRAAAASNYDPSDDTVV